MTEPERIVQLEAEQAAQKRGVAHPQEHSCPLPGHALIIRISSASGSMAHDGKGCPGDFHVERAGRAELNAPQLTEDEDGG